MRHKVLFSFITLLLLGCTSDKAEQPFPGEFIGADYILSDSDALRWRIASKQAEECIYPNLTRIQQQHFPKEDAYIHAQYVLFYPLEKIIGEEYVKIIQEDEKSMNYAQMQFKKFKDTKVKPLDDEVCATLRTNAKDDLAVVKGQYKNGMIEENKSSDGTAQNKDNVATNDNKFFFDIIKWGAALLL
ncbi:DUF5358 domain-containing protein [Glaesserella sp.]|uniref:DUF5358 domain-containing protein n=1 Tax=Glaesserella sp. TaxID=2094731 RepID=UPI0035A09519